MTRFPSTGRPSWRRVARRIRFAPWRTCPSCRSPSSATSATTIPWAWPPCPASEIVRLHASSGTTGKPTVVPYTAGDIDLWTDVMARTLSTAGVTKDDVVQNAYGYGLFTGGLGFHYGAERVGATVIPVSGGQTKRQIMLAQDLGSTVLCCTPSYALYLAEVAEEMGVDLQSTDLRIGIFGAEPWSQRDAPGAGSEDGPARHRHLRSQRSHRPRRQRRMRTPGRPAPLRGPLPAGDRRPCHRGALALRRARRARDHDLDQKGAARHPLSYGRHHLAASGEVCMRAHAGAHGQDQRQN